MSNKAMLIMSEDTPVLSVDFGTSNYEVLDESLLPWSMKGVVSTVSRDMSLSIDEYIRRRDADYNAVLGWLSMRTLSIGRRYAKKLYNALRLPQAQTPIDKAKVALSCRAVSVEDSYWVKLEGDSLTWEKTNLRHVPLNEIVTLIALHGQSLSLQGPVNTPEYTTGGSYAKAWRREDDGNLWLLKRDDLDNSIESHIEVMVSDLLDKTNVPHVHYESDVDKDIYVCKCPNMCSDVISRISGDIFSAYCSNNKLSVDSELKRLSSNLYYQMWVVDYLVSNTDRHLQNWGLYFKPDTHELLGLHPLFDHNNAFDNDVMFSSDFSYIFNGRSAKESAQYAIKRCDFKITQPIAKKDFLTTAYWESFQSRAATLGIKLK